MKMMIIMMIIENDNKDSDNNGDNDDKDNNDDNNDDNNKIPVASPHKGPIMMSLMSPLLNLKTTVDFLVIWDAMSLT